MYNPFASKPNPAVDQLVAMGFDRVASASALASSDNNVEAALQHLLDHPPPPAATAAPTPATHPTVVDMTGDMTEDAELAAAIALSKQTAAKQTPFQQTKPPPRPASNNKAATAALARSNGTAPSSSSSASPMTQLKKNHPSVKLPPSLESKPWHTQILRTSARIAPSSLAVDTLHRTLTTIQSNPTDPKFRRIDLSTPGFKRSLNNVPGALDFLSLGLGFQQTQGTVYTLPFVDAARMYACVGVLDEIKIRSFEYTVDRMERVFMKTLGNWRGTTGSEEGDCSEEIKRAAFMRAVPSPSGMSGTHVSVQCGGGRDPSAEVLSRKFASDDTLLDVLSWLGATLGSRVYNAILEDKFVLVNRNKHPALRIQGVEDDEVRVAHLKSKTLQFLDLFPSANLVLVSGEGYEMSRNEKEWRREHSDKR